MHDPGPLSRRSRRAFLALSLGALMILGGCDTTGAFLLSTAPKFGETPCQVVATWDQSIRYTPDPANNGVLVPGIAGRVYLFGASEVKDPLVGNGTLTVELFDPARPPGPNGLIPVYHWSLDAGTMQKLLRRDPVGMGYTLWLPCLPFNPQTTQVELRMRYDQEKCMPIYSEPATLTLNTLNPGAPSPVQHAPGLAARNRN
jgi:hypothetical protein